MGMVRIRLLLKPEQHHALAQLAWQEGRNISEIARDNLATVQEMSKATANLAQQAESLAELISAFRVDKPGAGE